jgi:hypothetical protein
VGVVYLHVSPSPAIATHAETWFGVPEGDGQRFGVQANVCGFVGAKVQAEGPGEYRSFAVTKSRYRATVQSAGGDSVYAPSSFYCHV